MLLPNVTDMFLILLILEILLLISPREKVEGKTIVYSTTNGTGIINLASSAYMTVIGSFLNIGALTQWLIKQERDVLLFCAGWKNRFNIEDTVCAGAIAEKLMAE